jgi:Fe-coproporphyrin III synthase
MVKQTLYHTYQRYRTLKTGVITALPIVILMPHSACNCRCIMCDIWKDNKNLKQLREPDISGLMETLEKWGTKQVLMSGGEAMLNPHFFTLCRLLKKLKLKITLLSTGLTLKQNAKEVLEWVDDVIVSLDGPGDIHNHIRNIPTAFSRLSDGVNYIKQIKPGYRITARTVIHRLNFRHWPAIIDIARNLGIDQVSFLPADISSHAFNRDILWKEERQHDVLIEKADLPLLENIIAGIIKKYDADFKSGFIAESPGKLENMATYYRALHGLCEFPYKKCNAPWVSAVVEADGTVRPCFFHEAYGNIHHQPLDKIMNSQKAVSFRQNLNMERNDTCRRCVCTLHLSPFSNPAGS